MYESFSSEEEKRDIPRPRLMINRDSLPSIASCERKETDAKAGINYFDHGNDHFILYNLRERKNTFKPDSYSIGDSSMDLSD